MRSVSDQNGDTLEVMSCECQSTKENNMTVKALIEALKAMPPEAEVTMLWDGGSRADVAHVWLARAGYVVAAGCSEMVYDDQERPASAPHDKYWATPAKPQ
jgi:hypothetical protein